MTTTDSGSIIFSFSTDNTGGTTEMFFSKVEKMNPGGKQQPGKLETGRPRFACRRYPWRCRRKNRLSKPVFLFARRKTQTDTRKNRPSLRIHLRWTSYFGR